MCCVFVSIASVTRAGKRHTGEAVPAQEAVLAGRLDRRPAATKGSFIACRRSVLLLGRVVSLGAGGFSSPGRVAVGKRHRETEMNSPAKVASGGLVPLCGVTYCSSGAAEANMLPLFTFSLCIRNSPRIWSPLLPFPQCRGPAPHHSAK